MPSRKNAEYKEGELELILSLAPTEQNISRLSLVLDRSEAAICVVYKIAYERGPFGSKADAQYRKVLAAKKSLGIAIGPVKKPGGAKSEPT